MPASLSALLLSVLLAGFWLTGRRRQRPFLRSTDTLAVAALNRAQIERLREAEPASAAPAELDPSGSEPVAAAEPPQASPWPGGPVPALSPLERRRRLSRLALLARGSRDERLQAMTLAGQWRHRDLLPLLRRGLRDPDPAVMAAAAAAIDRFRGRPMPGTAGAATGERRAPRSPQPALQRHNLAGRPSPAVGG